MSFLESLAETKVFLDASAIINLAATRCAKQILSAYACKWSVTKNAYDEIANGLKKGHEQVLLLDELISQDLIEVVFLSDENSAVYMTLVEGTAAATLDDGEASTIAYAQQCNGVVVIDERKARKLCQTRFPSLRVISTVEILSANVITTALERAGQVAAILNALRIGRMSIPAEHVATTIDIIGKENAATCYSLPFGSRNGVK